MISRFLCRNLLVSLNFFIRDWYLSRFGAESILPAYKLNSTPGLRDVVFGQSRSRRQSNAFERARRRLIGVRGLVERRLAAARVACGSPGTFERDRGRSRLGRLPLPREDLVESEIDKPAEKVHEGVDGVGGAEMQDARSQDFPTYCAQCRKKEGRPQAANYLSA